MSIDKVYLADLINQPDLDSHWFKDKIEPKMEGFEIGYRYWADGDFGSLDQVEFNSKKIGGSIDFWGLGWLGIFLWDYEKEEEIINVLLEQHEKEEHKEALKNLMQYLIKGKG